MTAALRAAIDQRREPVAIVGMGCRLPGASSPAAFWSLLAEGRSTVEEIPAERSDLRIAARWGGLLKNHDRFDAAFFRMSPREAERLDPQQRLLLEVTWEALEDAGQVPERLRGSRTGVFVGMWLSDWEARLFSDPERVDFHMTTGSGRYAAAGRISQLLGVHGPSLTLDTACSSSLVAVHLACQSLWSGESELALAAGVNVILEPAITLAYSQSGMMAADGRCKFGDRRADGYVRSEGAGLVVLKPLARALADGDPIYAVILGSAVNNDGGSGGSFGTPGRAGQEDLLRTAYRHANVAPSTVRYVEVHGTGTVAGDPVELHALATVLGENRAPGSCCVVGSVKTNIGHTEGAAGVAGLIKVALGLHHRALPASLHFDEPNPAIPWDRLPLEIRGALGPWPEGPGPLRAGVSSFGIAGTNAHVVLEEAPGRGEAREPADVAASPRAMLLPLSARSEGALAALARAYRERLRGDGAASLRDLCFSAATRRARHELTAAIVAADRDGMATRLEALGRGEPTASVVTGTARDGRPPRVAFVFPGQGSQWIGMGHALAADEPAFRASLEACDRAFRPFVDWSLRDELAAGAEATRLHRIDVVQPVLFAIQVALASLWRSWGIEPDAVIGHSMGEVAAAHVAGALSLADAARVICRRSALLRRISGRGAMAVVELSLDDARAALAGHEKQLAIAVSNGPRSTVLSGDVAALEIVLAALEARGVFCRRVQVDVASHSPQVDSLRGDLLAELQGIAPRAAEIQICSTVTGAPLDGAALDPGYWVRNLREPVLFAPAVQRLSAEGFDAFVEISPHPALLSSVTDTCAAAGRAVAAVPSLRRAEPERATMLEALGALYGLGAPVDWRAVNGDARAVPLPTYPWQRERFWYEAPEPRQRWSRSAHPILGREIDVAGAPGQRVWEIELSTNLRPELDEHRLAGRVVMAASLQLELALAAGAELFGAAALELRDVEFRRPLVVPDDGTLRVQIAIDPGPAATASFRIHGREGDGWLVHTAGEIRAAVDTAGPTALDAGSDADAVPGVELYRRLAERGVDIGAGRRVVRSLRLSEGRVVARIQRPEPDADAGLGVVGLLDACFHAAAAAALRLADDTDDTARVPIRVESIEIGTPPAARGDGAGVVHGRLTTDGRRVRADLELLGPRGERWGAARGLTLIPLVGDRSGTRPDEWLYEIEWRPLEPAGARPAAGPEHWLVLADAAGVGETLAGLLRERGQHVVLLGARSDVAGAVREAGGPCGVVDLRGLDLDDESAGDDRLAEHCQAVADVVRALSASEQSTPLWLITRAAQPAGETPTLSVAQAALLGLGRVIAEEHRDCFGGLVDLDPAAPVAEQAARLLDRLAALESEDEVAIRGGQPLVPRLVRRRGGARATPLRWRADATYLITGGLGSLGLAVARWMVREGARRLVLLGRTALPPRAHWSTVSDAALAARVGAVRDLERQGAAVHVASVDVGDRAQLGAFLEQFRRECWPPIRGVVHAAGVIDDRPVSGLDTDSFRTVLTPKAAGAWWLHRLLGPDALDFFVIFSSLGAVLGQPGQGNYAAANAFADALAHARRRTGSPAVAIDWGPWEGAGFAATAGGRRVVERLGRRGLRPLAPAEAEQILSAVLAASGPQIVAAPVDWARYRELALASGAPSLLNDLLQPAAAEPASPMARPLGEMLRELDAGGRVALLETHLREVLATVLRSSPARIDSQRPFGTQGLDSLLSLEFCRRLERTLGLRLSATVVWNYPSVAALAPYLTQRLEPATPAAAALVTTVAGDSVTDEDVEAALEAELARADELLHRSTR